MILTIIKERWKFYVAAYLLGYTISLIATGIPNILYLIPINISALILMIFAGNAFYYASQKMPGYKFPAKAIKYLVISIAIIISFNLLRATLLKVGIDISPFIGFAESM